MAGPRPAARFLSALVCACLLFAGPALAGQEKAPKGGKKIERYPPSFRLAVKEAIDGGVKRLRELQGLTYHWGNPAHPQAMGHTALPVLAMLKAGVPKDDPQIVGSLKALRKMPIKMVYSVALYMMVIHASYEPKLDTLDTDVGTLRAKRARPKEVFKKLSAEDRDALERGLEYLMKAQNYSNLWHYDIKTEEKAAGHDLSNTQYALLGLRAIMDCGIKVKAHVWRSALYALFTHQDVKGKEIMLREHRIKGKYVFKSKIRAEVRPFHYTNRMLNGPAGKLTVFQAPATGSMTTAGVACVAICMEGLWRSRKFKGGDRKKAMDSIRDGTAWMQENFTVTENPGHPRKAHHFYYLYGLERMGMLTGRRWLGKHDWYKEGADLLLGCQLTWGRHVMTSFAVLFLKRATRATDTVALTD